MEEIARKRLDNEQLGVTEFYQESVVAFESGLFFGFWELPIEEQAWIRAIYETQSEIQQVTDYVRKTDNEK